MSKLLILAVLVVVVGVVMTSDTTGSLFSKGDSPGFIELIKKTFNKMKPGNDDQIGKYDKAFGGEAAKDQEMVNSYYNMATDFYEYGWGQSFHFAHTKKDEGHKESIARHEHRLSDAIKLEKGKTAVDLGCGVGGPAREIASYSGGNVVGVTINDYQVKRGQELTKKHGLDKQVTHMQGDFTALKLEDGKFDAAYAIEATCHAPKLEDVYGEAFRVLKPGGYFGVYEWIYTPKYQKDNAEHKKILADIEYGDGLPPLRGIEDVYAAAKAVGFEVVVDEDLALDTNNTRPWYYKLDMNWFSIKMTHLTCIVTEFLGLAPKGTTDVHNMLIHAAEGLVAGGKTGIFTPMHLVVMRKPLPAAAPEN